MVLYLPTPVKDPERPLAHLNNLPVELLTQILSVLPRPTLKCLRLTSLSLSAAVLPALLHTVHLSLAHRSFDRLLLLAKDHNLSQHIRVLEYNTMVLSEHGEYNDYAKYKTLSRFDHYRDYKDWLQNEAATWTWKPEPPPEGTETRRRGPVRGDESRERFLGEIPAKRLRQYHRDWRKILFGQMFILQGHTEVERLSEILRCLNGLKEIGVLIDPQDFDDEYDSALGRDGDHPEWRGARNLVERETLTKTWPGNRERRCASLQRALEESRSSAQIYFGGELWDWEGSLTSVNEWQPSLIHEAN
ncbi:hypothetical protein IFR05_000650 [Cadophora sp. M221]|nr:hypothetical protein IFR05_000650 [Cadophora sp. M221]